MSQHDTLTQAHRAAIARYLKASPVLSLSGFSRDELVAALSAAQPEPVVSEPVWIVNDLGELGVKVGGRFFFLYKGDNIEYGIDGVGEALDGVALHSDGTPMRYRIVGKREFGETCWPLKWITAGRREDRYTENLRFTPGLSYGTPDDGAWRDLPASPTPPAQQPADDVVRDADPLQGAANWIVEALKESKADRVAEIMTRLLIGYNRAARLYDAAMASDSARKAGGE